jgi:tetratricopeptide (TPR) repeat protein
MKLRLFLMIMIFFAGAMDVRAQDKDSLSNVKYASAIAQADSLFKSKQYAEAVTCYMQAFSQKKDDTYAEQKLAECEEMIKKRDGDYAYTVKMGDEHFSKKQFAEAKIFYLHALEIKPAELYPKDQLQWIKTYLEKCEVNYKIAIYRADSLFKSKQYAGAITNYMQALSILPKKEYPKAQIEKCHFAMAAEKNYKDAVVKADALLNSKKFEDAKKAYQEALKIKAFDTYCEEQIKKIDLILEQ